MAYALVALKMLAGVDRLVTVPLGELLRRGVSEEDVLCAWDELAARALGRPMTPEGWKVPVEDAGAATNGDGRMVAENLPYWSRSGRTVIPSTRNKGFLGCSTVMSSVASPALAAATWSASIAANPARWACSEACATKD
jgi:hypothetical protein